MARHRAGGRGRRRSNCSGLDPTDADDDTDSGAKIHQRAARMAVLNVSQIRDLAPDLVVSDVITACGGMAAELLGVPWVELCPHPLYLPSKGLPPLGSGLAPGTGMRGRLRDTVMRSLTARSVRQGQRQRSAARVGNRAARARSRPGAPVDRHAARPGGAPTGLAGRGRRGGAAAFRAHLRSARGTAGRRAAGGGGAVDGDHGHHGSGRTRGGVPGAGGGAAGGCAGGGVAAGRRGPDVAAVGGGRAGPAGRTAARAPT